MSLEIGEKVTRSLDTQPFSPSASQNSSVPSVGREEEVSGYDLAEIVTKVETISPNLSPKNNNLNNSYEHDDSEVDEEGEIFCEM